MIVRPLAITDPTAAQWLRAAISARPLIALDFDGTLAPLVDAPDAAVIDPRAARLLPRLRTRFAVAVVSGRGLADLRERIGVDGIALVGSHGNEWPEEDVPGGGAPEGAASAAWPAATQAQLDVVADWASQLRARLPEVAPSAMLEVKRLSLSLHYRHAADPIGERARLAALCDRLSPIPQRIDGKFVWNLIPPGACTKFDALRRLERSRGAGTVIFVGDDATDELAFEQAPHAWLTVKVFDGEDGLAAGPRTAARVFVDGIDGVVSLLERLLAA